jgi:hypothetical protein
MSWGNWGNIRSFEVKEYEIEIIDNLPNSSALNTSKEIKSLKMGGNLVLNIWSLIPKRKLYKSLEYSVFGEYYHDGYSDIGYCGEYKVETEKLSFIDAETRSIIRKYLDYEEVIRILDESDSIISPDYIYKIFFG